uniref:Zinc finger CCCH-type containing 12Ab n=1 Tax=Tetraodon nigroviridis TaxID=99883 RepID=H3BXR9_TETNG
QAQLDFFHKLGYSSAQVGAVQQQFGPNADTDKVLGELVRLGAEQEARREAGTTGSALVSRGNPQTAAPHPPPPEEPSEEEEVLRPVVLDGSNVAMSHGNKEVFSCLGIQLAVDFFLERGHAHVTVFVPLWRKEQPRPDVPITDQHILRELERRKILVFTPSRRVAGKRVVCNDDWFIVKLAYELDGVIVSNDLYRDLQAKEPQWRRFIEERLLMYSFVNDKFMPPDDPLGRHGPTLDNFLRKVPKTQKKPPCPYGKKCTYGNKCKYHHPERAARSGQPGGPELREVPARQPQTPQRAPGQSLSLVEDMAKKLTLAPESGPCKDHKSEHVAPPRASQRSGRRSCRRRPLRTTAAAPRTPVWAPSTASPRRAPGAAPRPGSSRPPPGEQRAGAAPRARAVRGPAGPVPPADPPLWWRRYGPSRYCSYGGYPVSLPTYGHQSDLQRRQHWSDPFGFYPLALQDLAVGAPPGGAPGGLKEREAVRKKLLAIFSAHLVDAAMSMFPQLMDPEVLVAEILRLQSRSWSP